MGLSQGQQVGQPSTSNIIGYEVADPPLFTDASNPDCPSTLICRYSDAALFKYADTASWNHGRIFARQVVNPWLTYNTYRNIQGASDMFRTPSLFIGQPIHKMGMTTWVTTGTVEKICVKTRQYEGGSGTNRVMLCQAQSSYASSGGDSGGPVYRLVNPNDLYSHISHLLGLHWGRSPEFPASTPVKATFSEWYLVTAELAAAVSLSGWLEPVFGVCPMCGY
jgi:hypothetical protein